MKKRARALMLCLAYIGVLSGMLLIHIRDITGTWKRYMATAEILLLLVFSVAVVILSLRKQTDTETGQNNSVHRKCVENYEQFSDIISEDGLSEREKEVAWLIYRGFTNRQIGEELFIAETTVKKHVTHIFEKCNVSGRKELKEQWNKKGSML